MQEQFDADLKRAREDAANDARKVVDELTKDHMVGRSWYFSTFEQVTKVTVTLHGIFPLLAFPRNIRTLTLRNCNHRKRNSTRNMMKFVSGQ